VTFFSRWLDVEGRTATLDELKATVSQSAPKSTSN